MHDGQRVSPRAGPYTRRAMSSEGVISRGIKRLESLSQRYPIVSLCTASVVVEFGLLLPEDRDYRHALSRPVAWPLAILCCAGVAMCVHCYDLARERVKAAMGRVGASIAADTRLAFECKQLQDSYERWYVSARLPTLQEWAVHSHSVMFLIKLARTPQCGWGHQLLTGLLSLLLLSRFLGRSRLSPVGYSVISLAFLLLAWTIHARQLLEGDRCIGGFGAQAFQASTATGVLVSCVCLCFMWMATPVSQDFALLKVAINLVGGSCVCYLHMLMRGESVDSSLDERRWGLLWLLSGLVICSMACFLLSTALTEASMLCYMEKMRRGSSTTG